MPSTRTLFFEHPFVVTWYTSAIPALSYLQEKPNLMAEYGYRYSDPETGTFFSRLAAEELERVDSELGREAGKLVHAGYDPNLYSSFLSRYPANTFPLHYELRVRLFRRDSYWVDAMKAPAETAAFREAITIAFHEHKILERYYPVSYRASQRMLSVEDAAWMKNNAIAGYDYTSPVGGELLTSLSQPTYLSIFAALLALILWTLSYPLRVRKYDFQRKAEVGK
jgi:hypothetical protein